MTTANLRVDAKSVDRSTLDLHGDDPFGEAEEHALWEDFGRRYGGAWDLGQIFQPDTVEHSDEQITDQLGLDPSLPTVVVFAHVLWDASLSYGDDLFRNHAEWLVESVRAAIDNPRVNWVIKAHPSNVYRTAHGDVAGESREIVLLREAFSELPPHVFVLPPETSISTRSLYEFADVGVTVRGTPGLEMACMGKAVLTAGSGHYSGLGFTTDSTSSAEYVERLSRIERIEPPADEMVELACRYAYLLFVRRPWVTDSFVMRYGLESSGWYPLYRNVELTVDSVGGFLQAPDLEPWADWVLRSDLADYLPPAAASAPAPTTGPIRSSSDGSGSGPSPARLG